MFDTLCSCAGTQRNPPVLPVVARGMALVARGMASSDGGRDGSGTGDDEVRLWYENVLGWPTVPAEPGQPVRLVRLVVGVRFDVLDVPAEAGAAALAQLEGRGRGGGPVGFPVALCGGRMRLLVAAGSAAELPGLLEWLEWGAPLELDLTAVGAGGVMEAPVPLSVGFGAGAGADAGAPAGTRGGGAGARGGGAGTRAGVGGPGGAGAARGSSQGAAVWLRPPGPERGAEASLPTLSAMGARDALGDCGSPPDLARVVNTVATQVHRVRLRRARAAAAVRADAQPLAFS